MSAIVVVRPRPETAPNAALAPLHGLFDVVVDGINLTARVGEGQALTLLGELGLVVSALASGRRARATVALYSEEALWELGLEASGHEVLISVFRSGACAEVAVHERRVELQALRDGVLAALGEPPVKKAPAAVRASLELARRTLEQSPISPLPEAVRRTLKVAPRPVRGFGLRAEARFRSACLRPAEADPAIERADLHALLVRGELAITASRRTVALGTTFPFLLTERLVALAEDVLDAALEARPLLRQVELGGLRIGVRRTAPEGAFSVRVRRADAAPEEALTFPEIEAEALALAIARFAGALVAAFRQSDPEQQRNLRLGALERAAVALLERADGDPAPSAHTNPEPESYRSLSAPRRSSEATGRWEHGGKMRFLPRWVATVPNIDLRATFLCGERLIVGSARETICIQRQSGGLSWRVPTLRAPCVPTPSGLVRFHADGRVTLLGLDDGQVRFSARVAPRAHGGPCGAVIHGPGLPKLVVVCEGERQVTAIDLVSGEVRWRYTAPRPGRLRVRRAGRLLLVASSDGSLSALDAPSGEIVWRHCGRQPLSGELAVDHESAFAIASVGAGAVLHHFDPYSGELRWSSSLEERALAGQPPLITPEVVVVPLGDRRGSGARAFSRSTGASLWSHEPGLASPTSAFLAVDDAIVVNSAAGTLQCIEASSGACRFSHVFPRHVDADQPRRLEPVLRSGALFVPQYHVHVVRPKDGEIIGTVPTDLIPDLLRVDERCDVYVAEESGHLAAFGVAPKLTLVK
jgi:outer membrane protein assembly factor BamB